MKVLLPLGVLSQFLAMLTSQRVSTLKCPKPEETGGAKMETRCMEKLAGNHREQGEISSNSASNIHFLKQ